MHCARGGEENVGWSKRPARVAADEFTGARSDKVDLIACVWLLRIGAAGRVNFNLETSVPEDVRESLPFGSRETFERLDNSGSDAWVL